MRFVGAPSGDTYILRGPSEALDLADSRQSIPSVAVHQAVVDAFRSGGPGPSSGEQIIDLAGI
jgi:hypothetical protein